MPFHKVAPEKLSQSVVRQIEELILRGILRPGERLPSERDLAEKLGVSRPSSAGGDRRSGGAGLLASAPARGCSWPRCWGRPSHPRWCELFASA
jgi:GntR family transcriptional regulator, transcriptional repressor for pyruvate dehydrogenase complex